MIPILKQKLLKPVAAFKKTILIVLFSSAIALFSLWLYHNYYLFNSNSGYLQDYVVTAEALRIADNATQSSGLTFNPDTNQLYVIVNSPSQIHVLSAQGQYLRSIELHGFGDTEGISYIGNNIFAVVSERRGLVSWFTLHPQSKAIEFDPEKSVHLFERPIKNIGLEGITYSAETSQLFIVKERKPKKIYALKWPVTDINSPKITIPWDAEAFPDWFIRSYSGLSYQADSGHLFVLSRRSRSITEYTPAGLQVGSFSLKAGSADLPRAIRKAEGIVISPDGTLYLCGEPNQLYIFKKIIRKKK